MVVLEYLRVLLSTQIVVGAIAVAFLCLFKDQIRSLLTRIALIKWGSAELSAPQPPSDPTPSIEQSAPATSVNAEAAVLPIPADTQLPVGVAEQLTQAFQAERARAHLWEYRYLNYFLVPNTQNILDWLSSLPNAPTYTMYDAWWQASIPGASERKTIINALENHSLLEFQGELLVVTPKGREYIQWRGPRFTLPALGDVS